MFDKYKCNKCGHICECEGELKECPACRSNDVILIEKGLKPKTKRKRKSKVKKE